MSRCLICGSKLRSGDFAYQLWVQEPEDEQVELLFEIHEGCMDDFDKRIVAERHCYYARVCLS